MPAIRKLSYDYTFPFYFQAQLPHVKVHAYFAPVTPADSSGRKWTEAMQVLCHPLTAAAQPRAS